MGAGLRRLGLGLVLSSLLSRRVRACGACYAAGWLFRGAWQNLSWGSAPSAAITRAEGLRAEARYRQG